MYMNADCKSLRFINGKKMIACIGVRENLKEKIREKREKSCRDILFI